MYFNTPKELLGKIVQIGKFFFKVVDANKKALTLVLLMGGAGISSGQSDTIAYELPGDGTLWKNGVQVDPKTELDTLPYNKVWRFTDTSGNASAWGESGDCDIKTNDDCSNGAEIIVSVPNSESSDDLADYFLGDGGGNVVFDASIDGMVVLVEDTQPLDFLSFTAKVNKDTLEVDWETVNLVNVEKMEVEISADGGEDFVPIASEEYSENH